MNDEKLLLTGEQDVIDFLYKMNDNDENIEHLFIDKKLFQKGITSFENNTLLLMDNIINIKEEYDDEIDDFKYHLALEEKIFFEFKNNTFIHPNYLGVEIIPFIDLLKKHNLINKNLEIYLRYFNKDGFITFNNINSFLNRTNKNIDLSWIKYKDIYPYINEDISLSEFKIKYNIVDQELTLINEYLSENNFSTIGFNLLKAIKVISPKYNNFFLKVKKKNTLYHTQKILYSLSVLMLKYPENIEQIINFAINETNYNFKPIINNYNYADFVIQYYIDNSFELFNYKITEKLLNKFNINKNNKKLVYAINNEEPLIAIIISHKITPFTKNEKKLIANILNNKGFDKDLANQMLIDSGLSTLIEEQITQQLDYLEIEYITTKEVLKLIPITEFEIWDTLIREMYNENSFILNSSFNFNNKIENILLLYLSIYKSISSLNDDEIKILSKRPFLDILKYGYRKSIIEQTLNINQDNIPNLLNNIFEVSLIKKDTYVNKEEYLIINIEHVLKQLLINDEIFNKIFGIPKVNKFNIISDDLTSFEKKQFENYYHTAGFLSEVKYLYVTEKRVIIIDNSFSKYVFKNK